MSLLLAGFESQQAMEAALDALRRSGIDAETHTPVAPEKVPRVSVLPLVILIAGLLGFAGTFALEAYATGAAYPINVGGRPYFSWPAYIPMAFEAGVLIGVSAGFFGFFIINRLPHLYDPIDESDAFRQASRDRFFLAVRGPHQNRARAVLHALSPAVLEELAS